MDLAAIFSPATSSQAHPSPSSSSPALGRQLRPAPTTTSNYFLSLLFFQDSNSLPTASLVPHEQHKNFQFLRRSFEAVLASMVRDRHRRQLVILCPVQQSLMGFNSVSKLEWEWGGIDEEFISSHIVQVPERDHPAAKSLTVSTLNGRSLILTDTTVTTAKGFKQLKQARLVAEKIFYDNEGRGWVVHFIDRPLVGISHDGSPVNSNPGSPSIQDARRTLQPSPQPPGSPSSNIQEIPTRHRRNRQRSGYYYSGANDTMRKIRSRPILTLQLALQRFPGVSQKLEQLIMTFNDSTMFKSDLKEIRSSVDKLLIDSVALLNQLNANALAALLEEYRASVNTLDQLLENYIMNSTYDIVFFKVTLFLKQQDWDLAEAIRELRNLDLGQVGLPDTPQYHQALVSALNEFQSIGVLRTPEEKLNCLIQSIRVTSNLSGGADDLIPTLLLTVLRSGISNLASNLYYMKNFVLFDDTSRGEYGYSLSTLEAVSRYIMSHVKQLAPISAKNQIYWETVCAGDIDGMQQFTSDGSEINITSPPGLTRRLSTASFGSSSDQSINSTLQMALSASPMHSRDAEGNNSVLLACKSQQLGMLRHLLESPNYTVEIANYGGTTPLMLAAILNNLEMARIVLEHTKDKGYINRQDVLGNSAVHLCVAGVGLEMLEELLKSDPDLGQPNNEGDTALIIATKQIERTTVHGSMASLLGQRMKKQDFDRQNNSGDTALHFVSEPALIVDLVTRGADPSVDNYAGWTPLLKWALHDNTPAVRTLLETKKVDVLMTDSRGYTPLHMACLRGNLEMATMLKAHTPIDIQSNIDGSTPLQLACQSGSLSVVEYLLQEGANPELRDWTNESPADMTSDSAILDRLDNAMLFWDSRSIQDTRTKEKGKGQVTSQTDTTSKPSTRVIRVVRGTMEQDGKVRYIVKSGNTSDKSTIVTMPRSLDDFKFLRQTLLLEGPDACIPSLEHFYSPFLLSPSRPSKAVLTISTRRLDMFLNYLSDHPVLGDHELVWEFMLMPELQRDMIMGRSQCKQESLVDSIFDNYPPVVDDLEHEEKYFEHLNSEILRLESAVQLVRKCSRKLSRSTQDVPQQLNILGKVLNCADLVTFDNKGEYVSAIKAIAATQTMMHTSDIESLGNLFEDFSFVIDGTLKALQHPQEVIANIRQLRALAARAEQSTRRNELWWSGLSTIGEGAMTALGGAGYALGAVGEVVGQVGGAVGQAASSTFGAATGSSSSHSKTLSEGSVTNYPSLFGRRPPPPSSPTKQPPGTPPMSVNRRSSILTLSPSPTPSSPKTLTPIQARSSQLHLPAPKAISASSILASPFSSIASVASAATGQVPLEEIKDKMGKASSLLNSLHGSLFEELAHLQSHHTKELERAMKDFGARQLQIEKSRLRDMMEILSDLQTESTVAPIASGSSFHSSRISLHRPHDGPGDRGRLLSRQSSYNALASSWISDKPLDLIGLDDEKEEARLRQREYEIQAQERREARYKDEDTLSEKVPFDDTE
ncbi:MAG: hypothetical protein BYD32DRAFT_427902 [Podila humilis]|nr:MAG: hypothetical protein BYD32DRAFT_427902 [Podila humilis]